MYPSVLFSWCFDPFYDILWSFDADKVRVIGYSNAPTMDQQNIESEPQFFRSERQLLQCTELCLPMDTELRYSDAQMAVFMLTMIYALSLSALAAIPTSLKEPTRSVLATSSENEELVQMASANRNEPRPSVVNSKLLLPNQFIV